VPVQAFVVEDNASIRESLIEALAELADVETAGTATTETAAVAWLTDPAHPWDIAIVDLVLETGGGNGLGVLRALRGRDARRKVVVLTGTASAELRRHCEMLGADRVFDKSMDTDALIDYCIALGRPGPQAG
jgi:DNA-binding NarL/FixJ family response regulator